MKMDVLQLNDRKVVPDLYYSYSNSQYNNVPIVIDNGSYNCRAGWAISDSPDLIFKNLLARPRKDRGKKDGETLIGNDIMNIEAVRFQLKSQFDRNVVTQFQVQEHIFDYIFSHLGIDTIGSVDHPIVLTEPLINPNYCRILMSELLFECYHVPSVCYGVDSLFSYIKNTGKSIKSFSLIIACGYHCTHVIPIVAGQMDISRCKRIDVGGYHIIYYLHRLLQLKYPAHFNTITFSKAEALLHDHGRIALDYQIEASLWSNLDYYQDNVKRIQLPYNVVNNTVLTPEEQRDRRREIARKLVEMNARKREEKLIEDEENLNQLIELQDMTKEMEFHEEIEDTLHASNIASLSELNKKINHLQTKIQKTRLKMSSNAVEEPVVEEPKIKAFKTEIQLPKDDELKPWLHDIYKKRLELLERRSMRRQHRQDMAKRGTAAAQERMRLINQLARKEKSDDDFGIRDEDWDVYKVINKEGGDTDSEEEQEKLAELEELLKYYDPLYAGNTMPRDSVDTKESYQLHIGLERLRAPEILFQPSMIGCSQAGIAETVEFILKGYPPDIAEKLAMNIFLTGGPTQIPGFLSRMDKELLEIRPFKSTFFTSLADNSSLDAWYGAKLFAATPEFSNCVITYQDYQEKGGDYIKEHLVTNPYISLPVSLPSEEVENVHVLGETEKNILEQKEKSH